MKTIGIYKITNNINNKCYIGSSNNIKKRLAEHKRCLRLGNHHSIILQRAYIKYGLEKFSFDIIKECCEDDLLKFEQEYFGLFLPEYNVLRVAGSFRGYKHTDETKELLRQKRKNQIIGPCSEETKRKIGAANKDRIFSEKHKLKLSKAHLGKELSELHKNNISKACTSDGMRDKQNKSVSARRNNNLNVRIVGIDANDKIVYIYLSIIEAAENLKIHKASLWRIIKKGIKHKDYIWKKIRV